MRQFLTMRNERSSGDVVNVQSDDKDYRTMNEVPIRFAQGKLCNESFIVAIQFGSLKFIAVNNFFPFYSQ
jgi:hypothetical protein